MYVVLTWTPFRKSKTFMNLNFWVYILIIKPRYEDIINRKEKHECLSLQSEINILCNALLWLVDLLSCVPINYVHFYTCLYSLHPQPFEVNDLRELHILMAPKWLDSTRMYCTYLYQKFHKCWVKKKLKKESEFWWCEDGKLTMVRGRGWCSASMLIGEPILNFTNSKQITWVNYVPQEEEEKNH